MSRSLESLERKVSRESPSEQVGQESSKHVEEDESREDGSEGQDSVGFGNLELSFELVESGTARREGGKRGRRREREDSRGKTRVSAECPARTVLESEKTYYLES